MISRPQFIALSRSVTGGFRLHTAGSYGGIDCVPFVVATVNLYNLIG
jgi:hypothetical protein